MSERDWSYPPLWQERREDNARCACGHCDALRADAAGRARSLARYVAAMHPVNGKAAPAGAGT